MEAVLHVFGICADNHLHLDFLDLFMIGGSLSSIILYVKMRVNGLFQKKKDKDNI
jgi:hypothetical protein